MRLAWIAVAVSLFAVSLAADDPFVLRVDETTRMHSTDLLDKEAGVQRLLDGDADFFWIRYRGRAYVIRDVPTLREINAAFDPMRALSGEKMAAKERVRPLRQRAKSIHRQLRHEDDAATRARLERELDGIQRDLDASQDELERVRRRKDELRREAERKMMAIFERALRNGVAVAQ